MATALWQNAYALSIRKGPINLGWAPNTSDVGAGVAHNPLGEIASNSNDGTFTTHVASTVAYGGDSHFQSRDPAGTAAGQVMGQKVAESGTWLNFGMPVIGNPDFSVGQEYIENKIRDGWSSARIAPSTGVSSIQRAGQSPTCNFDFMVTDRSLISAASLFFQKGAKEVTAAVAKKVFTFPVDTDGPDPLYYGCFLRKMSATGDDSRMLSDAIATEMTLKASQTEPLTCSMSLLGRLLVGDVRVSDINKAGQGTLAANMNIYNGRNFLLQNAVCTLFIPGTLEQHIVLPIESFSISAKAQVSSTRYNSFFPLRYVLGDYSADGSIVISASGMGTNASSISHVNFTNLLADAGIVESAIDVSTGISSMELGLYWGKETLDAIAPGEDATAVIPSDCESGVLAIRSNIIVTDVQFGGDAEATLTISFRCMNFFNQTSGALERHALQLNWYDPTVSATSWGFTASASLFKAPQEHGDRTEDL